ncbi:MAG: glycosyltransferase family 4 protein [Alphaproteobacteria bacterium]|nr:glycosyltransferase family 4 protein [Alphaproteobacteria bacterium]
MKFVKKLMRFFRKISIIIACSVLFVALLFGELILCSKASFSDFFTTGKVSALNDRPKNITKNIVVDTLGISTNGGIKTLTENVINSVALKRPDWYFTVLGRPDIEQPFNFRGNNIKIVYVDYSCSKFLIKVRDILNTVTGGYFRDQIMQLLFYDNILFNKSSCDLFFDPYAEFVINDYSVPKISLIHDILYFDAIKKNGIDDTLEWKLKNAKAIINSSKKIITVSDYSRKHIIESYNVPDDFVKTIHIKLAHRIKEKRSPEFEESVLKKFRINDKKYLVYPSIARNHKNHVNLFRAFTKFMVQNNIPDIKLVIVGTISSEAIHRLNELIDENSENEIQSNYIKGKVVFTNFIPNSELDVVLSHALAMIFPSLYEGFGMPIIEAMNAGVPVTCSNVTSLPEIAGNAALFFDPHNVDDIIGAIKKITTDESLRKKLIQLGYERAKYFSDKNAMIDSYIKLFEQYMN